MPYVERVTKAGNTIEIERYFTSRYKKKGISRGDKVKPTKEEQEKVNTRQAERKLRILINANYGYGDYHLVLDYIRRKGQPDRTPEQMRQDIDVFLRECRKEYRKAGLEFKYIHVMEIGKKGARHHHLVVNKIDTEILQRCWYKAYEGHNRVKVFPLDDSGNYAELASYLIKYTGTHKKGTDGALQGNGEVWQCVEDANIAWHCGASSYKHAECRNANSIGIEMCVRKKNTKSMGATDKDWYFEDATVEAAAELTRYLMNKYGVPASHVIRHYDVTGKICPNPYVYNTSAHTWDEFKRKISGQAETPQGGNEKTIWNFLTGKGLNAYAVAGIMGNLYAESGLMPNNLQNTYNNKLGKTDAEYTAAVDNGSYGNFVKDSAGYGLAQWTYWSRKQALLNHAKQAGVSIADLNMQLGFLWEELQGYTAVMDALKKAGSVRAASDAVLTGYEKPADQSETVKKKRAEYGEGYYKKYAAGNGTKYYRVRKSWTDAASQLGAFTSLENAKSACKAGYTVYDDNGKAVYTAAGQQTSAGVPFSVQVDILDLNIRTGAGTNYAKTGETTGKGVFTIVEVKAGQGASAGWGRLKSGAGWISLDYATRLA